MTESKFADDLIQLVVGRVLRGEDPDVEGLIASTPDMPAELRDQLHEIARAFSTSKPDPTVARARSSKLPFERLGPYRLVSHMGEGGMGMVFLAEHEFLARRVALKLIRPELAFSDVTRQRFQREAMSIAKLRHANIVSVYDAGEHDGVAFLAMELVDGRGLDEMLQPTPGTSERMDVITAVRHARDIALALQCAHDAGIIHRDVKPSNVRITPDGRALLLDFGLSLADEMASLTQTGQFRGTPQYASPEQVDGDSSDLDARTDVYSLGITLYKCLTGELPFSAATTHQLFHQILVRKPVAPRRLNASVDSSLNGIVMRALEKKREDRFGSAQDMARALDEWLASREQAPPTAPPASPRRNRVLAVAAIVIMASATALIVLRKDVGAAASASEVARQVAPRSTIKPFGAADAPLKERLRGWEQIVGPGAWGPDDGTGVTGSCAEGITLLPFPLGRGSGSGRVSGSVQPIDHDPAAANGRTSGAGVGIELSDERVVALLMTAKTGSGYEMKLCELRRDGASGWMRASKIESSTRGWSADAPLKFTLSWNDEDVQFAWGSGASVDDHFLLPRKLRQSAWPKRLLLIVEKGNARFDELIVEES